MLVRVFLSALLMSSCSKAGADCPLPVLKNDSSEMWIPADWRNMQRAQTTCAQQYNNCLVRWIKKDHNNYYAICGAPDDRNRRGNR